MLIYVIAFAIAIIFGLLADFTTSKSSTRTYAISNNQSQAIHTYALLCSPLSLLFITCLRYGVGYDYLRTYMPDYYQFKQGLEIHSDIGFRGFYFVSQLLSDNPQVLFAITGFILILCFYLSAYLLSGSVTLSLCLLFLSGTYVKAISMISQFTAIAFLLLAFSIHYGKRRLAHGKVISTLLIILAPTFHVSALFPSIILIYFIYSQGKNSRKWLVFSTVFPFVVLILERPIVRVILTIVEKTRFNAYINSEFTGLESKSILYTEIIIFIIMTMIVLYTKSCSKAMKYLLILQSFAVCCSLLQEIPLMFRMTFYFASFNVISLPLFVREIQIKWMRYITITGILFLLLVWFLLYPYPNNTDGFLPYQFVFNIGYTYH